MVLDNDVNHSSDAPDWKTLEIYDMSAIFCQKYFDVINYVTFSWMTCGLQLSKLKWNKVQKCFRMRINIYSKCLFGEVYGRLYSSIQALP